MGAAPSRGGVLKGGSMKQQILEGYLARIEAIARKALADGTHDALRDAMHDIKVIAAGGAR